MSQGVHTLPSYTAASIFNAPLQMSKSLRQVMRRVFSDSGCAMRILKKTFDRI